MLRLMFAANVVAVAVDPNPLGAVMVLRHRTSGGLGEQTGCLANVDFRDIGAKVVCYSVRDPM